MNNKEAIIERINTVKFNITFANPFLGNLILHLLIVPSEKVKLCETDGESIFVNLEAVDKLEDTEIEFILLHQIHHIILLHLFRSLNYANDKTFNKACDYVVNANIMSEFPNRFTAMDNLGEVPYTLPNGKNAVNYTAEQVYNILKEEDDDNDQNNQSGEQSFESIMKEILGDEYEGDGQGEGEGDGQGQGNEIDSHSMWQNKMRSFEQQKDMEQTWSMRIKSVMQNTKNFGNLPGNLKRQILELTNPTIDWRTVLKNFVEEEITDYSFNPPDKRQSETDLFLPDFNEVEEKVCNVFFFVDVSGSMSEKQVSECVEEVRGCINQYNGRIDAYMAYFDYSVSNIKRFEDEEEMLNVDALGGGGTSFENIFKYLREHENEYDGEKKKVIILTDGYAEFPSEELVGNYELLWIINNENVTPPIGDVVRIESTDEC